MTENQQSEAPFPVPTPYLAKPVVYATNDQISELDDDIAEIGVAVSGKQNTLTAGENITIVSDVISASGGGPSPTALPTLTVDLETVDISFGARFTGQCYGIDGEAAAYGTPDVEGRAATWQPFSGYTEQPIPAALSKVIAAPASDSGTDLYKVQTAESFMGTYLNVTTILTELPKCEFSGTHAATLEANVVIRGSATVTADVYASTTEGQGPSGNEYVGAAGKAVIRGRYTLTYRSNGTFDFAMNYSAINTVEMREIWALVESAPSEAELKPLEVDYTGFVWGVPGTDSSSLIVTIDSAYISS